MSHSVKRRDGPLFITGDSRSGTTFLANILIHHEEIGLAPESRFAIRLLDRTMDADFTTKESLVNALDFIYEEPKFLDWELDRSDLLHALQSKLPLTFADLVRETILNYCDREFPRCPLWGLKKGDYIHYACRLVEHFPGAKFIHLVRDGRAVFNSKKRAIHSSLGKPLAENPMRAAVRWNRFLDSYEALLEEHPQSVIEIHYEKLVTHTGEMLHAIFHFLGAKDDTSLTPDSLGPLDPAYVTERSRHLHPNVGKPPRPERIDAWREELRPEEILAYETVAGENLFKKGYRLVNTDAHLNPTMAHRIRRSIVRFRKALGECRRP
jgi:hypothetical protein